RAYCRSVRAHNCAALGEREPMDAWAVFRVGRRYAARVLAERRDAAVWRLEMEHDSFRPDTYRRELSGSGETIVVRDLAACRRASPLVSRVLLHPEVSVAREGGAYRLEREGLRLWLTASAGALRHLPPRPEPPEGW